MAMINAEIQPNEYGDYYKGYISLSNNKPLSGLLMKNAEFMESLFLRLTLENALFRYEEGKWSIKEMVGHITDTERIFSYRALSVARDENRVLAGYDHNLFVENANFDSHSIQQLQKQYHAVRQATLTLCDSFSDEDLLKKGEVNSAIFSVRALLYAIAGHEMHHINILNERYLPLLNL